MIPSIPGALSAMLVLLPIAPGILQESDHPRDPLWESTQEMLGDISQESATSPRSLWALYERDDRDPDVLDALRYWLRETENGHSRRVIDTVLNHWEVPHEALTRGEYMARPHDLEAPEEAVPWLVSPLEGDDEELLKLLDGGNPKLRLRAAFTLIMRGPHSVDALRSVLLNLPRDHSIRDVAGTSLGEAIGLELSQATTDERRQLLLDVLERNYSFAGNDAMEQVLILAERNDFIGHIALGIVEKAYELVYWSYEDWTMHHHLDSTPIASPVVEERLARIALRLLEEGGGGLKSVVEARNFVQLAGLRSAIVKDAVTPKLIEILRETNSNDVLQILCHFGVDDEFVRQRYIEALEGWTSTDSDGLESLPCWKEHDGETLAAFDRVFSMADSKAALANRLAIAGLLDASRHEIVRRFMASMGSGYGGAWAFLREKGFRYVATVSPDAPRILKVHQLGVTIATLMERDEDYSAQAKQLALILRSGYDEGGAGGYHDYYQWGFSHALALGLVGPEFVESAICVLEGVWPFSTHTELAWALLNRAELTKEHKERLARFDSNPSGPQEAHGISPLPLYLLDPAPNFTRLSEVPRLRQGIYKGNLEWLDNLCGTTPLIRRDEEYVLALLTRGTTRQRRQALNLIQNHELQSAEIRATLVNRKHDSDRFIRELVGEICASRGW